MYIDENGYIVDREFSREYIEDFFFNKDADNIALAMISIQENI